MSSGAESRDVQRITKGLFLRCDRLLDHISRILATSSGTNSLLQTLQYTLYVLHTQLSRLRTWKLRKFALEIARKASTTLLPGQKMVATIPSPTSNLDNVIGGSKALSGLISDFRMFTRLWGLVGVYDWGKSTWLSPPEDNVVRAVIWTQVLAGVGYQWYENVAYLAMKGVLRGERFNERKQAKWYEWSSRFWMAHVVLDVLRLARVWQLNVESDRPGKEGSEVQNSAEHKATKSQVIGAWRRAFVVNMAWAPITAHYSWEQGCISDHWVGLLGFVASGTGFIQLWKRTA